MYLLNLIEFQVLYNVSIFILCRKTCIKLIARNIPPSQGELRPASACHKGQLCGLLTDSLALPFIQYGYIVPFLFIMCPVFGKLRVKQFHLTRVIMAKTYLVDEEMHEIMQNSSYEEYVECEEEEDNEKNNVQIEEEIHDETEASALQRKEDSDEVIAALCTTN